MKSVLLACMLAATVVAAGCEHMGGLGQTMERNPEVTGGVVGGAACALATGEVLPTAICAALGAGVGYLVRQDQGQRCRDGEHLVRRHHESYCVRNDDLERRGYHRGQDRSQDRGYSRDR